MKLNRRVGLGALFTAAMTLNLAVPAAAIDIISSQYAVTTAGMPLGVALAKGYFKEAGADITGIRSSPGGGPAIRDLLAGDLPYAEASLVAVIQAAQKGADLKIVCDPVRTVSEVVWVTLPNSPIKSVKELKGKKIGYASPLSTTQALTFQMLDMNKYTRQDVQVISTGSFINALTALEQGAVDVAVIGEPLLTLGKGKYKPLIWASEIFPPTNEVIGVTTGKVAREKPELVRGIIEGRRKAVKLMTENRAETFPIIAKAYQMDEASVKSVLDQLLDHGAVNGIQYWSECNFNPEGIKNLVSLLKLVGVDVGDFDWRKLIDESFLPADLRGKVK